jgi:NAD(P)-dependent dehydrogenase (short-subunit alcohol dehydrogenase family)
MSKTVVITGSTRGIGHGLAHELLKRGCSVVISGRTQLAVDKALSTLAEAHGAARIFGQAYDVTDYAQLDALWRATVTRFGRVDIWINNAGISTARLALWQQNPKDVHDVINTNLLGVMYGCQVALHGMLEQRSGAVYNMEGFGSTGMTREGMATYGASKRAVTYLTKSLVQDVKASDVIVGTISPGIVATC